jgi:hypothetical protein
MWAIRSNGRLGFSKVVETRFLDVHLKSTLLSPTDGRPDLKPFANADYHRVADDPLGTQLQHPRIGRYTQVELTSAGARFRRLPVRA